MMNETNINQSHEAKSLEQIATEIVAEKEAQQERGMFAAVREMKRRLARRNRRARC